MRSLFIRAIVFLFDSKDDPIVQFVKQPLSDDFDFVHPLNEKQPLQVDLVSTINESLQGQRNFVLHRSSDDWLLFDYALL